MYWQTALLEFSQQWLHQLFHHFHLVLVQFLF